MLNTVCIWLCCLGPVDISLCRDLNPPSLLSVRGRKQHNICIFWTTTGTREETGRGAAANEPARASTSRPVRLSLFLHGRKKCERAYRPPAHSPCKDAFASMSWTPASSLAFPPAVLPAGRRTPKEARPDPARPDAARRGRSHAQLGPHLDMHQLAGIIHHSVCAVSSSEERPPAGEQIRPASAAAFRGRRKYRCPARLWGFSCGR